MLELAHSEFSNWTMVNNENTERIILLTIIMIIKNKLPTFSLSFIWINRISLLSIWYSRTRPRSSAWFCKDGRYQEWEKKGLINHDEERKNGPRVIFKRSVPDEPQPMTDFSYPLHFPNFELLSTDHKHLKEKFTFICFTFPSLDLFFFAFISWSWLNMRNDKAIMT